MDIILVLWECFLNYCFEKEIFLVFSVRVELKYEKQGIEWNQNKKRVELKYEKSGIKISKEWNCSKLEFKNQHIYPQLGDKLPTIKILKKVVNYSHKINVWFSFLSYLL